jgi:hypothetical protein
LFGTARQIMALNTPWIGFYWILSRDVGERNYSMYQVWSMRWQSRAPDIFMGLLACPRSNVDTKSVHWISTWPPHEAELMISEMQRNVWVSAAQAGNGKVAK